MKLMTFELDINASCWEDKTDSVPNNPGLYFVYGCYKEGDKWYSGDLIYIGESGMLKDRIVQHYVHSNPDDDLSVGLPGIYKKLWYTYALYNGTEAARKLCESALIFRHKPLRNKKNKDNFEAETSVSVVLRGEVRKLVTSFRLDPDNNS